MNRQTEDRLRAAFDAKAQQVTDERLDVLAARRPPPFVEGLADGGENPAPIAGPVDLAGTVAAGLDFASSESFEPRVTARPSWLAPALAAAAVVAVAARGNRQLGPGAQWQPHAQPANQPDRHADAEPGTEV